MISVEDFARRIFRPVGGRGETETFPLRALVDRVEGTGEAEREPLIMDPDYQRGYVWTETQQARFAGHMLEGGFIGPVIMNRDRTCRRSDEIVDGKQRLSTMYRWLKGELAAALSDGAELWASDLAPRALDYATSVTGPHFTIHYVNLERLEVLELYRRLNRGGTVHGPAELARLDALIAVERNKP